MYNLNNLPFEVLVNIVTQADSSTRDNLAQVNKSLYHIVRFCQLDACRKNAAQDLYTPRRFIEVADDSINSSNYAKWKYKAFSVNAIKILNEELNKLEIGNSTINSPFLVFQSFYALFSIHEYELAETIFHRMLNILSSLPGQIDKFENTGLIFLKYYILINDFTNAELLAIDFSARQNSTLVSELINFYLSKECFRDSILLLNASINSVANKEDAYKFILKILSRKSLNDAFLAINDIDQPFRNELAKFICSEVQKEALIPKEFISSLNSIFRHQPELKNIILSSLSEHLTFINRIDEVSSISNLLKGKAKKLWLLGALDGAKKTNNYEYCLFLLSVMSDKEKISSEAEGLAFQAFSIVPIETTQAFINFIKKNSNKKKVLNDLIEKCTSLYGPTSSSSNPELLTLFNSVFEKTLNDINNKESEAKSSKLINKFKDLMR